MNGCLKFILSLAVSVFALNSSAFAQLLDQSTLLSGGQLEAEKYVPRKPTPKELEHYAFIVQTRALWNELFDNPNNAQLHWQIAKNYIQLESGDIALHELERAEALGIERSFLLADIAKAYLLRGRYEDIINDIFLEEVPLTDHGEIHLAYGQAYYALDDLKQSYVNFIEAKKYLVEDRLELNKPLANLYNLMGDYEAAEENVDKAFAFDEKDAELLVLKGELLHRREGAEVSYKYFELADFYRPDDVFIQSKLAAALYNLNRNDEAMIVLRKILAEQQSHPYANFLIAALFAENNNIRTATRYLNQAGDVYDEFVPGLLLKGKLAYALEAYQDAERALTKILQLTPENGEARRLLGVSLLQLSKYEQAVEVLTYLPDNNMLVGADFLLLGSAYALYGDNDKATEYLRVASNDDLVKISEAEQRKLAEYERGDNFGITLNLSQILNENPNATQRLIVQTYSALAMNRYSEALELSASIINQNRMSPIGFNLLGLSYFGQKKLEEARSNFRRAIEIDRDYHIARLNLAKLELEYGIPNDGISLLNEILARDDTYVAAYELLSKNARYEGDLIQAEQYLVSATNFNPNLISVHEKLSAYYFAENEIAKAKNLALQMVQNFANHPAGYRALGAIYLVENNIGSAIVNLEKVLEYPHADEELYLMLSKAYMLNDEPLKARIILKTGLMVVKDILPLQRELIQLAKLDGNFINSYHYVDQLKLSEKTKAEGFLLQGDLNLQENRVEDAINSYQNAAKAGAQISIVNERIEKAGVPTQGLQNTLEPIN